MGEAADAENPEKEDRRGRGTGTGPVVCRRGRLTGTAPAHPAERPPPAPPKGWQLVRSFSWRRSRRAAGPPRGTEDHQAGAL